jgi:hypothetical protein
VHHALRTVVYASAGFDVAPFVLPQHAKRAVYKDECGKDNDYRDNNPASVSIIFL